MTLRSGKERWAAFMAALDAPPRPVPQLPRSADCERYYLLG